MEVIASSRGSEIWLHEMARPYQLPNPFNNSEYVCILFVNDIEVLPDEQKSISSTLIKTGCKYAVCAGHECSSWDDSIEIASMERYPNFEVPDDQHIMATWHENESVDDIVWFGLNLTNFDTHEFKHYLILFVGPQPGLRQEVEEAIQSGWFKAAP